MFINNGDLKNLIELENVIYKIGIGKVKAKDLEKEIAPHFHNLYNLIEKLQANKKKTNEKNYNRIKEKRKLDKNYAR